MTIEVLRAGPLTTIQDGGRPGLAHLGVPRSGAADLASLREANALAGNRAGAAALETTLAGPVLRFGEPARIALAGAPVRARIDGEPVAFGAALEVAAGSELEVGTAASGLRTYVAVRGGIGADPVLGSRSTDTLTGIGPPPLRDGDVLAIGDEPEAGEAAGTAPATPAEHVLRIVPGPREDMFTPAALAALGEGEYAVSPDSSRVGVRFTGPALERAGEGELLSEGLVRGALQVPAAGMPIAMLADHPTTGGYPVIAVVAEADIWRLGQLRPGDRVHFRRDGTTGGTR
jgi:biotin-dependent carboxylase-like uncharacterized protein